MPYLVVTEVKPTDEVIEPEQTIHSNLLDSQNGVFFLRKVDTLLILSSTKEGQIVDPHWAASVIKAYSSKHFVVYRPPSSLASSIRHSINIPRIFSEDNLLFIDCPHPESEVVNQTGSKNHCSICNKTM